jgi:hypothetical protein
MPKWITAIFVFFLSTTLLTAKAITVEDVISKHVQAMAAEADKAVAHAEHQTLSHYIDKGYTATLEGVEAVDGTVCYKLKIDLGRGCKLFYLIDGKNWYVMRRTLVGNPLLQAKEKDTRERD